MQSDKNIYLNAASLYIIVSSLMLPFTQMWGKKDIPSVRLITLNEPTHKFTG